MRRWGLGPSPPHPFESLNKQGGCAGLACGESLGASQAPAAHAHLGGSDWMGVEWIQGAPSLRLGQPLQHSRPPAQGWGRPGRDFITYVFAPPGCARCGDRAPQLCKAQERYSKMGDIAEMGLLVT